MYHCPCCGHKMEPIFCECEGIDSYRLLYKNGDERLWHSCGLPLSPEMKQKFEGAQKEINN